VLLLASDGVHSALLRSTDLSAALAQREPRLAAEYVVAAALDRGGMDDATALVVRIDSDA
jgi:serine/threonine protein phosphatase PrpC